MKKINNCNSNNFSDFHYIFLTSQASPSIADTFSYLSKNPTSFEGYQHIYLMQKLYFTSVYLDK